MNDWRQKVRTVLNKKPTAAREDLHGGHPVPQIGIGNLCPRSLEPGKAASGRRAHLFRGGADAWWCPPAAPRLILPSPNGVTKENVHCAAWAKPVCVPMARVLGNAQMQVVRKIAKQVDRLLERGGAVGPAPEAVKKLKSKRFDYNGQPVDHMLDLDAGGQLLWSTWRTAIPPARDRATGETPRLTCSSLR